MRGRLNQSAPAVASFSYFEAISCALSVMLTELDSRCGTPQSNYVKVTLICVEEVP